MSKENINKYVDITDVVCPMTFVKVKVALDEIEEGELLKVKINDGEPIQNVPRSLKSEGHKIISVDSNDDSTFNLLVEKGGD